MAISKNNDDVAAAARRVCYRARVRANRGILQSSSEYRTSTSSLRGRKDSQSASMRSWPTLPLMSTVGLPATQVTGHV